MNIADQIYTTMYDIIVIKLLPSLVNIISNLNATGFFKQITVIAIMVVGLLMIYAKMNRVTFVKSFLSIFIVYSLFVSPIGNIYLLNSLRSLFIDGPIEYGGYLVNTIASVIYNGVDNITHQTINLAPSPDGTAFGKLWQISTDLASAVWDAGGLSDIGAFFIGAALYAVAIFLLVAQILMLGTFLIMSVAAIFAAPLFIPMILFSSTRQMFQSWVGFGLGGAFGLIMLMIMMGIIFGFVSITFIQVFGIDLSTGDVGDIDDISDMGKIGAMVVFMLISIKLLPKIEMWASSLAGASAAGISDASMSAGSMIGRATGLTAKASAKKLNEHAVKPTAGAVKRGLGRALNRFRNRASSSKTTAGGSDTKQKLAASRLKNAIRNRLVDRGQNQKRPFAQLANKEQGIAKRQIMQQKKNPQQTQNHAPQNKTQESKGPVSSSRGLNKNVNQSEKTNSSNNSKESTNQEKSSKTTSTADRPIVNNNGSKGSSVMQTSEKTTSTNTQTQKESKSISSDSFVNAKKTSVASSQNSSKTTNTALSQKAGNTSQSQKEKPADRNAMMKQKQAQDKHRQHLESLQQQQEIKRRDPKNKTINKKKKGDDEE